MGFFIGSSDKQQEDNDMLLYVEDADVNQTVAESTPIIENDAAKISAELIDEIQIIAPSPTNLVPDPTIPEVVIIDDVESSEIEINASAISFTVSPNSDRSRARYRCKLCNQIKSGHTCPYKNSGATATVDEYVPEEPLVVGSRTASNRENLSRLAQRVEADESSADPDWLAPNGNNTPSMRTTPNRRSGKRKLTSTTNEREENSTPKRARKVHECRNCHVPMKGHKCYLN